MAAEYYHVTAGGAGDNSGDTWANAMAHADFITDLTGSQEAGDIYYLKPGTYTFTGNRTAFAAGTALLPVKIIGVKDATTNEGAAVVFSDWESGATRPLLAFGAYYLIAKNFFHFYNLRSTGTGTYHILTDSNNVLYNVHANNTGSATKYAFRIHDIKGALIGCEGQSVNGNAVSCSGYAHFVACYFHDSVTGVDPKSLSAIVDCVIDTCTTGINLVSEDFILLLNNTIYGCTTGITATDAANIQSINNNIDGNTNGANWTTANQLTNFWANNFFDSDGTPRTNVTEGPNEQSAASSGMNDPANADFSITAADTDVADKGLDAGDLTGATV